MKRLLVVAICLVLLLCGCAEAAVPQSGNYYAQGTYETYMRPYVYISTEDGSFVTGAGSVLSYAEVGEFTIDGDELTANTLSCRFVFEIADETTLVLEEFLGNTPYEMHEGMNFILSRELQ